MTTILRPDSLSTQGGSQSRPVGRQNGRRGPARAQDAEAAHDLVAYRSGRLISMKISGLAIFENPNRS